MIDFQSATWHSLRNYAEQRLESARLKNDDPNLTVDQTAAIRGEIRVWKELLNLPKIAEAELSIAPVDYDG